MAGKTEAVKSEIVNGRTEDHEWSEKQYRTSLAHLEQLQDQLDDLRSVIPRIVHALAVEHPSPESLYTTFKDAAWGGSRAIDVFKTTWHSPETKTIFDKSKESVAANPRLDVQTIEKVPRYGWIATIKAEQPSVEMELPPTEPSKPLSVTETKKLIKEYRGKHSDFQVTHNEEQKQIKVSFKMGPTPVQFVIVREAQEDGQNMFPVKCMGSNNLCGSITRCMASRANQQDLSYALEMIAAYQNIGKSECEKCHKLLDVRGMNTTALRPAPKQDQHGGERQWIASHESCL